MTGIDDGELQSAIVEEPKESDRKPFKVRPLIHDVDPYLGLDRDDVALDLQGWGSSSPVFADLVNEIRPSLIIEVGSWKGGSAVSMAEACLDAGLQTEIVCVDTWQGAPEFWEDHADVDRYKSLRLKNGYPQVYYTFLSNMVQKGLSNVVTPFPIASTAAATFFERKDVIADLIYIDGSHETNDVLLDLAAFYKLLSVGGCIFGDDIDAWPSVKAAVMLFASRHGLRFEVKDGRYWVIRKTREIPNLDVESVYRNLLKSDDFQTSQSGPLLQIAGKVEIDAMFYQNSGIPGASIDANGFMTHPPSDKDGEISGSSIFVRDVLAFGRSFLKGRLITPSVERKESLIAHIEVSSGHQIEKFCFQIPPGITSIDFAVPFQPFGAGKAEYLSARFSATLAAPGPAYHCALVWNGLIVEAVA